MIFVAEKMKGIWKQTLTLDGEKIKKDKRLLTILNGQELEFQEGMYCIIGWLNLELIASFCNWKVLSRQKTDFTNTKRGLERV